MRGRFWCLGILMSLTLSSQSFAIDNPEIGPRVPTEGTIRFDLYRGYLIVARGTAGPLKGLSFLLDTGANPTILDPWIARKLHLPQLPSDVQVIGGRVQATTAVVPSLNVGPIQRNNLPVSIEDLSFFEKIIPVRIDGMIGLDVLGQTPFVIDYAARQIHFGPLPAMPDAIPLQLTDGLAILDAQVNDLPLHLLLDTGSSSLFLFARSMPGRVWDLKVKAAQERSDTIGKSESKQVKLQSLRLGTAQFVQEPAFVVADSSHGVHRFDGLVSPIALGMRKVAIDLGRGEVAFSR
jgi:predicted aspartyl protease